MASTFGVTSVSSALQRCVQQQPGVCLHRFGSNFHIAVNELNQLRVLTQALSSFQVEQSLGEK